MNDQKSPVSRFESKVPRPSDFPTFHPPVQTFKILPALLALALALSPFQAQAATFTWDPGFGATGPTGGSGTWNLNSNANWSNGTSDSQWTDSTGTTSSAVFAGSAGTVSISGSLGAQGVQFNTTGYTLQSGTLILGTNGINASSLTSGVTTIDSALVVVGTAENWSVGSGASLVAGGIISGTGGITVSGTGFLALAPTSGSNSYSGATTLTTGTLEFRGASAMSASSAFVTNGGTLSLRSDSSATFSPASYAFGNGATINIQVNELTTGSNQTLTIANNVASNPSGSNSTINVSSTSGDTLAFGSQFYNNQNGSSAFGGNTTNFNLTNANVILNGISASDGGIVVNGTGGSLTLSGNVNNGSARTEIATVNSGTLILTDTYAGTASGANWGFQVTMAGGTLDVNGSNTMNSDDFSEHGGTSATLILTSGTLNNTSGAALTETSNPVVSLNGNFSFGTVTSNTNNNLNLGTGGFVLPGGAPRTITINGSTTLTIGGGTLTSSTDALVEAGTGTLVLSGSSQYTGGTTINGGTLNYGNVYALGSGTAGLNNVAIGNGTLQSGTGGTLNNNIVLGSGSTGTIDTQAFTVTETGNISGGGGLTKIGSGALTLSGSDSYTGATQVNGGTLTLNGTLGAGTVGGTAITNAVTFNESAGGVITGTSSFTNTAGTATLAGVNNYSGVTNVTGGTLTVSGTLSGAGQATVSGGGRLTGNGLINGLVTVTGGTNATTQGGINLTNLSNNKLTLAGGLTVGSAVSGSYAQLNFLEGSIAANTINCASGVFTVNTGGADISITNGGGLVSGSSYNLITFGSGAGAAFTTGTGTAVGGLVLTDPSLAFGLTGYLTVTGNAVELTATGATLPTAYWWGGAGTTWTGTNSGGGNFTTDAAGQNQAQAYPSLNSNVIFSASNAQNFTQTLGANFGVNSVTFSGSGAVTINNDGNTLSVGAGGLTVQGGAGNVTLGVNLAGAGAVTAASNLLALLGTNSYTGGTVINSGTVQINSSNSLGTSGTVQMSPGTTIEALNTASSANPFALSGDPTIKVDSGSYTISGVIADGTSSGYLVETGSGTLVLANTETYSGQTQITSGTLQLGNGATDGVLAGTSGVVDNSAILFDPAGTDTAAYGISGSGSVSQIGAGKTILSGSNSFSGATTLSSGTLEFQGYSSMSGSSALSMSNSTTLSLRANTSGTFNPTSFGPLASGNTYNLLVNGLTASGTGNTLTLPSPSPGYGSSNMTINVSSTSSDTLQFSGTTFQITSNSGSAFGGAQDIFNLNNANVILNNGLSNSNNGTFVDGGIVVNSTTGNSLTINGNVYAGGNPGVGNRTIFAILNSGVLTLNNSVTNNGGINFGFFVTLNGGTLNINASGAINTNASIGGAGNTCGLTLTSGTLNNTSGAAVTESNNPTVALNGNFAFGSASSTGSNSLNLGTGNVFLSAAPTITVLGSGTLTLGGAIQSSANGITEAGASTGTLKLTGSNAYTGGTTLNGGTLQLGNANALGSGTLTIAGGSLDSSVSNLVNNGNNSQAWNASFGFAGTQNLNLGAGMVALNNSLTVTVDSKTLTVGGSIGGGSGLMLAGAGTLDLTGSNSFSGGLTVTSGTLQVGNTYALGAGSITANGGVLDLHGFSPTVGALSGGSGGLIETLTSGLATLTSDSVSSGTYAGVISDGSAGGQVALIQAGAGALALTGNNTYSGGTTINAGAVQINSDNSLGNSSGAVALNNGGTLEVLAGDTISTGRSFALSGTGAVQVDNGSSYSISGQISDGTSSGSLTKSGNGTLTLSNANNNYSGATSVNGGTLIVSGAVSGSVTVNSGATLGGATGVINAGGTVNGSVNVAQGGTLAPGAGQTFAGTAFTIGDSVTMSGTSTLAINLSSSSNTADYLYIGNNLILDSGTTDTLTLNVLGAQPTGAGTYTYIIAFYNLNQNGSGESGTFGNNIVLNGDAAIFDGINYNYNDGGYETIAVTLTVEAIPEPGTWGMLLSGAGMLIAIQRVRRRKY
jgi:autotransporter-associated beta strand protein